MKSTKKSLILSVLSLVLCISMLLGTTYAWFTDSVTSGKNRIVSGNLDVDVKHTNSIVENQTIEGKTNLFCDADGDAMLWEPGAASYETFTVENLGTLALKYNLALAVADYNAVSGTDKTLKDVLKVKVLTGSDIIADVTREAVEGLDWTTSNSIDDFKKDNGKLYPEGTEGKDSSESFQVIIYWKPSDIDNDYNINNGKTTTDGQPLFIEFGINVVATQLDYEQDSFDETYDEGTVLPTLAKSINKVFESAPIVGTTYDDGAESVLVVNKNDNASTVATVPAPAVKSIVENLATGITTKQGTDVNTVLYLSVTTNEITELTASYNIDLSAVMTYVDQTTELETQKNLTSAEVDALLGDNIVTAIVNIGTNLIDVKVKHAGSDMTLLATAETVAVGYFYDSTAGNLTIKTKSFSPFEVTFKLPEAVKAVKEVKIEDGTNTSYMSFAEFRDSVNAGNDYSGKTATLLCNVDLGGEQWLPIGLKDNNRPFAGIFDGDFHTITNLYIKQSGAVVPEGFTKGEDYFALFGFVTGTVKNLTVYGSVEADNACGIVARLDGGTVSNLTSYVSVNGLKKAAGITVLAQLDARLEDCTNNGAIQMTVTGSNRSIGGIVGMVNSPTTIVRCTNDGSITTNGTNAHYAGGIVGYYQSDGTAGNRNQTLKIEDCTNNGNVVINSANTSPGGIVGKVGSGNHTWTGYLWLDDCKNTGNLPDISGDIVGGIADCATSVYFTEDNTSNPARFLVSGTLTVRKGKPITNGYNIAYNTSNVMSESPSSVNYVNPTPIESDGYDIYTGLYVAS